MSVDNNSGLTEEGYRSLLGSGGVITLFQPIVSVKNRSVLGFEALSRGIGRNDLIPPAVLFKMARSNGTSLEFDRLCREKAIETFSEFYRNNREFILSINIDSSVLTEGRGSNHLFNLIDKYKVEPSSIIIEILESEIKEVDILYEFVERYKKYKFLIAIDDIGAGFSNFERVIALRPDVIKIDRFLIDGVGENFYKQEIVKSIVSMTHGIGSVTIAEGIESEDDAVTCLEFGVDYLQGFLFSVPVGIESISGAASGEIELVADKFRNKMLSRIKAKRVKSIRYELMIEDIISQLTGLEPSSFNGQLVTIVMQYRIIECIYILNEKGIQVSDTVFRKDISMNENKLFRPDPAGTNQSYKNYFFNLMSGLNKFTSNPYISKASGKLCTTISTVFQTETGIHYVLCCDIIEDFQ